MAGLLILEIVEKEHISDHAWDFGSESTEHFNRLAERYEIIGDVRIPGLFIVVDVAERPEWKMPATASCNKAWGFAMDHGLISQFGGEGRNILKLKLPLTSMQAEFDKMLKISEETITFIRREVSRQRSAQITEAVAVVRSLAGMWG